MDIGWDAKSLESSLVQLRAWAKIDSRIRIDPENARLLCSMRAAKSSGRVSKKQFAERLHETSQVTSVGVHLFVLWKSSVRTLPEDLMPFVVDVQNIPNVPPSMRGDKCWFINDCVDKTRLVQLNNGQPVMDMNAFVHSTTTMADDGGTQPDEDDSPPAAHAVAPEETPKSVDTGSAEGTPGRGSSGSDLQRWPSGPSTDAVSVCEKSSKSICDRIKSSAEAGFFLRDDDPTDNKYMEFWVRSLRFCIEARAKGAPSGTLVVENVANFERKTVLRLIKTMLSSRVYKHLSRFTKHLDAIDAACPGLLPPLGRALSSLACFDVASDEVLQLNILAANQDHYVMFTTSELYNDFLRTREEDKLQRLRSAHGTPDAARHEIVCKMQAQAWEMPPRTYSSACAPV